ncbi:hypothetical protein FRC01_001594, partial [Tulasnella sp. 417]
MQGSGTVTTGDGVALYPDLIARELQKLQPYFIPLERIVIHKKEIGSGGFGVVKCAELKAIDRPHDEGTVVVVKELKIDGFKVIPERAAARLVREVRVWSQLDHENILPFTGYYLGENYDPAYLISPYMKNGNLKSYLQDNSLDAEERLKFAYDTIKGLEYLHTRDPVVVHGDLKAANVLVNDHRKAQLCDFGLAIAVQEARTGVTTSHGFTGSVRWCSPEVIEDTKKTIESDIWSWGCLVLEMMTDKMPYQHIGGGSDNPVIVEILGKKRTPEPPSAPNLPEGLLDILRKCWNFDPKKRPPARDCLHTLLKNVIKRKHEPEVRVLSRADKLRLFSETYFIPAERINFQGQLGSGTSGRVKRGQLPPPSGSNHGPTAIVVKEVDVRGLKRLQDEGKIRLAGEMMTWSQFNHENILPFTGYYVGEDYDPAYLISPYMKNGNIRDYLKDNNLDPEDRLNLAHDTIKGLEYLHTRDPVVVHGDLKAANILVNDQRRAQLCSIDLSIVIPEVRTGWTTGGGLAGSIRWCSPEVMDGKKKTVESDMWSWGCLVLEIMTGMIPFSHIEGGSDNSIVLAVLGNRKTPEPASASSLPEGLLDILRRCWNFDPQRRPDARFCLRTLTEKLLEKRPARWDLGDPIPANSKRRAGDKTAHGKIRSEISPRSLSRRNTAYTPKPAKDCVLELGKRKEAAGKVSKGLASRNRRRKAKQKPLHWRKPVRSKHLSQVHNRTIKRGEAYLTNNLGISPQSQAEQHSFAATPRPFKNLASKAAAGGPRKAKAVKIMLLAERDRELAEVNKVKKLRAKALAEKRKAEGEAMDIDGPEGGTRKEESPAEEDALICYSTIEAPPSLIPATRYCDITGLEAPYTDPLTGLRYHDKDVFAHIRTLKPSAVQAYL